MEQYVEILSDGVSYINGKLTDYVLVALLLGVGLFYTITLGFVQIRKIIPGFKTLFGEMSWGHKAGKHGMSSFQAFATAVAGQVGTGNIAGAATAIATGGPGAIFWMWVSAFFGMSTIYAEAILAQKYKGEIDGHVVGGPAFYIKEAFKGKLGKFLSIFFSVAIVLALGFMGNMVQANTIGDAMNTAFHIPKIAMGIIIAVLAGFVFFGGVKRIAAVTEKMVPIMALLYILGCIIALVINRSALADSFLHIFEGAFGIRAVAGAAAGEAIKRAMSLGVKRGLFSNEAGMGSTPHAHALAKVSDPRDQGMIAMVGVFIDTFVICTLTALVVITSGFWDKGSDGIVLAQEAFTGAFGGFGAIFIAICLLFFAFSTIISWYFFGETNIKLLFGTKAVRVYAAIVLVFIIVGTTLKVNLVWNLSDLFNSLMVLPNVLGLLALAGVVSKVNKGDFDG